MKKYTKDQVVLIKNLVAEHGTDLDKSMLDYGRLICFNGFVKELYIKCGETNILVCAQENKDIFYAPFEPEDLKTFLDTKTNTKNSCYG